MSWQIVALIVWVCLIGSIICRELAESVKQNRYKLKIKPHHIYMRLQDHAKESVSGTIYEFREVPVIDKNKEKEQAIELTTICPYCATDIKSHTVDKLMNELHRSTKVTHMSKDEVIDMKELFENLNCHIINDFHEREPMTKGFISTMIDTKCPKCKSRFQVYYRIRKLRKKSLIKSLLHVGKRKMK